MAGGDSRVSSEIRYPGDPVSLGGVAIVVVVVDVRQLPAVELRGGVVTTAAGALGT